MISKHKVFRLLDLLFKNKKQISFKIEKLYRTLASSNQKFKYL